MPSRNRLGLVTKKKRSLRAKSIALVVPTGTSISGDKRTFDVIGCVEIRIDPEAVVDMADLARQVEEEVEQEIFFLNTGGFPLSSNAMTTEPSWWLAANRKVLAASKSTYAEMYGTLSTAEAFRGSAGAEYDTTGGSTDGATIDLTSPPQAGSTLTTPITARTGTGQTTYLSNQAGHKSATRKMSVQGSYRQGRVEQNWEQEVLENL